MTADVNEIAIHDYKILMEALFGIIDANGGNKSTGTFGMFADAKAVGIKLLFNARSALILYENNIFNTPNKNTIKLCDFTAINTIARMGIESFLVFYWIYLNSHDKYTKEYRYILWRLCCINFRLSYPYKSDEFADKIKSEIATKQRFEFELIANPIFLKKRFDEKKKILERTRKGMFDYFRPKWSKLLELADFKSNMYLLYKYLCDFSHTGHLSTIQVRDAISIEDQKFLSMNAMRTIMFAMSHFILGYCTIMDASKSWLQDKEELLEKTQLWCDVGIGEW